MAGAYSAATVPRVAKIFKFKWMFKKKYQKKGKK